MQTTANSIKQRTVRHRAAGLALLSTALCGATVLWVGGIAVTAAQAARGPAPASLDEVVAAACWLALTAVLAWMLLAMTLELLAGAGGRAGSAAQAIAQRVSPPLLRRCAAVLLGAGLAVGPGASLASAAAMPSLASLTSGAPAVARPASDLPAPGFAPTAPDAAAAPDPSWVPTRPSVRAPRGGALLLRSTRPSTEASTEASAVVVRRGDSLWSIVAAALGPGATDAAIARTWPLWYAQNRALIGADPDVLLPGMQLQAPERSAS